ncbi:hypothetical protein HY642_02685 [Candidatus Woesearchaeota archaeon]|nr:hypothetical protein [Candidatus Woesearchaeota archaeon]
MAGLLSVLKDLEDKPAHMRMTAKGLFVREGSLHNIAALWAKSDSLSSSEYVMSMLVDSSSMVPHYLVEQRTFWAGYLFPFNVEGVPVLSGTLQECADNYSSADYAGGDYSSADPEFLRRGITIFGPGHILGAFPAHGRVYSVARHTLQRYILRYPQWYRQNWRKELKNERDRVIGLHDLLAGSVPVVRLNAGEQASKYGVPADYRYNDGMALVIEAGNVATCYDREEVLLHRSQYELPELPEEGLYSALDGKGMCRPRMRPSDRGLIGLLSQFIRHSRVAELPLFIGEYQLYSASAGSIQRIRALTRGQVYAGDVSTGYFGQLDCHYDNKHSGKQIFATRSGGLMRLVDLGFKPCPACTPLAEVWPVVQNRVIRKYPGISTAEEFASLPSGPKRLDWDFLGPVFQDAYDSWPMSWNAPPDIHG